MFTGIHVLYMKMNHLKVSKYYIYIYLNVFVLCFFYIYIVAFCCKLSIKRCVCEWVCVWSIKEMGELEWELTVISYLTLCLCLCVFGSLQAKRGHNTLIYWSVWPSLTAYVCVCVCMLFSRLHKHCTLHTLKTHTTRLLGFRWILICLVLCSSMKSDSKSNNAWVAHTLSAIPCISSLCS